MIKLVICDLDGVLCEAREIHFLSLNKALELRGYDPISKEEHLAKYDGLPTRKKLEKLHSEKGIQKSEFNNIWEAKQDFTQEVIRETIKSEQNVLDVLIYLQDRRYRVYCASNSIISSIDAMLSSTGYDNYIEKRIGNDQVSHPKPHSEMYLQCMVLAGVNPKETLIIEDSHIGRLAAHNSGAHVLGIKGTAYLNKNVVKKAIDKANKLNTEKSFKPKWQGGKMNVLIPMAGAGSRFEQAGYTFPKPLIEVNGKPMIQTVVENINVDARHIFIVQKEHYEKYNLQTVLSLISPDCEIVQVEGITEGAACTTLLAKSFIDNEEPLLIANSDQFVEWDSNEFLYAVSNENIDGGILTFESMHPKWSYAKTNDEGYVVEVAEKNPISTNATVGIYYWNKGEDYVKYAEQMIDKNMRVNGEFYVCPVFNEAIEDDKKFRLYDIEKMWGLGTPEDLDTFLKENK